MLRVVSHGDPIRIFPIALALKVLKRNRIG